MGKTITAMGKTITAMGKTITAEVWVCVDADGEFVVGTDRDAAIENYEEEVGALTDADGFRLVKIVVKIPMPVNVIELEATATDVLEAPLAVEPVV